MEHGTTSPCLNFQIAAASATGLLSGKCSPAGYGSNNEKRFDSRCDRVGQGGIRRLQRIVFGASEEAQERTTLVRDMIADRATEHGVLRLEGIEHGTLRDWTDNIELYLGTDARQRSKMARENDANHWIVWTSTESTAGRCCTMGVQLSPASAEP